MAEKILLTTSDKLNIEKTFECGQCFRWNADENGVYRGVAGRCPAKIWEEGGNVYVLSDAPESFWQQYFDLELDYAAASEPFRDIPYLNECVEDGFGIRILRQDKWEALCSFIISQCNNIKRIKGIVEHLCESCGEQITFLGDVYYAFPTAERISGLNVGDLSDIRAGYREEYIIKAAKSVSSGELNIESLGNTDYSLEKKQILALEGVGEKVANCFMLFGLHHMEAFPIDVWIRRALDEHFPADFNPNALGPYAGLAQQYIFYHIRG